MKIQIADAAAQLLIEHGLDDWTLDRVAARARCAKGLVLYHHRNRAALLAQVAGVLRRRRADRRLKALSHSGPDAIDALWRLIEEEVASGEATAWLALLALREPDVLEATGRVSAEEAALGPLLAKALELEGEAEALVASTVAALDGFAIALLRRTPRAVVREAYHRFWLGLLG
ncbi:MAG TPA: helix-turn-helix domain-containing protein [Gemmatimonadales bacterium]|nr:helix-turn-helix domain-containing protein [Gemmatimonadales bacterium]